MHGVVEVEEHPGEEAAGAASTPGARKARTDRTAEDFIVNANGSDIGSRRYFGYPRARHEAEKTDIGAHFYISAKPTIVGLKSKAEESRSALRAHVRP